MEVSCCEPPPKARASLRFLLGFLVAFLAFASGFQKGIADLLQRLVLNLSDALLRDADDLADLLEREGLRSGSRRCRGRNGGGSPSARRVRRAPHRCCSTMCLTSSPPHSFSCVSTGPFSRWLDFSSAGSKSVGKALAVLAQLHALTRERLEDRPARVGAELEAATAVELVDRAEQRHVALADQVGEVHLAHAGALCHGQHQREIGLGDLLSIRLCDSIPAQQDLGLFLVAEPGRALSESRRSDAARSCTAGRAPAPEHR